ncbi:MAG: ATP-grasp domain-containing protein [Acidobacteria bacterium]|nr:ATP-grasp domain-containing protein [Acidobacteriota bacterium]
MPEDIKKLTEKEVADWKSEYEIATALKNLGHEIQILGAPTDFTVLKDFLTGWNPHVVFNQLEEFLGVNIYMPYLLGYFDLMHQPFTGCNPASLILTHNKPLMKKILAFHRVPVPRFAVFPLFRTIKRPRWLPFPLFVKSTIEHSSLGIAQASVVSNDEKLKERVEFIHRELRTDAMAEEYIDGRELYVGVLGNHRLRTFPVWELRFGNLPAGTPQIATAKVKWDLDYQRAAGITTGVATDLPAGTEERIRKLSKRVCRILGLNGYARLDFRLTPEGRIYLLEPNPNPDLGREEDFALSARQDGMDYETLIQHVLNLGLGSAPRKLDKSSNSSLTNGTPFTAGDVGQ